jgi:hypothetical protein
MVTFSYSNSKAHTYTAGLLNIRTAKDVEESIGFFLMQRRTRAHLSTTMKASVLTTSFKKYLNDFKRYVKRLRRLSSIWSVPKCGMP